MRARQIFSVLVFCAIIRAICCHGEMASWYGEECRGRLTANGERFESDGFTCASWQYPFGTRLRVSYEGRSVVVRVNDRGPARRLHRAIDLSQEAFKQLADTRLGLINVIITKY